MKCHLYTGEGLLVGWTDVRTVQVGSSDISGPFHPNDFYWLIQPTMRLFRWPADVPIGEFYGEVKEQEWREFRQIRDEIDSLHLTLKIIETGQFLEVSCLSIEEDGTYILHGYINKADQIL